ncbi:Uncharacterised protein [Tatumella ptyseos]|uniref:Peptidoglycan binding-like domain-containing protein n=4 Tax=Tatumella ptyseos TaxID=82987 RepID=A0A2X5NFS3_9GAMM|nr:Uncharacterised protein [Tatumella ptyseos]
MNTDREFTHMTGRSHAPMTLHPDRLFSSVGTCGTNAPAEVKKIQQLISGAGYRQSTGRTLKIDGQCGQGTIEAIRWYQRLLNMSPSGLITSVDTYFIQALSNALSPHWRPRNTRGALRVYEGQITFDAEGSDYITAVEPFRQHRYPNFSRILHWPGGRSGVTLGRGYDMRERSTGEIYATLRRAGIEEFKAVICSRAAYLRNHLAAQFVKVYGPLVGEITHEQQIRLFEIVYRIKSEEARSLYSRLAKNISGAPSWNRLDRKIRDVVVDIFYQGVYDAQGLIKAAIEGKDALASFILSIPQYRIYEDNRKRVRYLK